MPAMQLARVSEEAAGMFFRWLTTVPSQPGVKVWGEAPASTAGGATASVAQVFAIDPDAC